jgi:hypothetical protein
MVEENDVVQLIVPEYVENHHALFYNSQLTTSSVIIWHLSCKLAGSHLLPCHVQGNPCIPFYFIKFNPPQATQQTKHSY